MENNKTYKTKGLIKDNGSWASAKKKMLNFLQGIDEKESVQTLDVLLKQGKSKVVKGVDCLNIEVAPIVLTQFKPTQRRGKKALEIWFDFMKFVKVLLENGLKRNI